jgi:hypothetical protein
VFDEKGTFRVGRNDHRYQGINNAWIRYVSQGRSAYRLIYLRTGEEILLYRAGPHSVEDRLVLSAEALATAEVTEETIPEDALGDDEQMASRLLHNYRSRYLSDIIFGRRLIPHKEVILVSPFVSPEMMTRTARFGKMLDRFIEDGSSITLVTLPPLNREGLAWCDDLESRNISVLFHNRLHSKLYLFCVDQRRVGFGRNYSDALIIGSSNLTSEGFPAERDDGNEELCYELPLEELNYAEAYVSHLMLQAVDTIYLKTRLPRR